MQLKRVTRAWQRKSIATCRDISIPLLSEWSFQEVQQPDKKPPFQLHLYIQLTFFFSFSKNLSAHLQTSCVEVVSPLIVHKVCKMNVHFILVHIKELGESKEIADEFEEACFTLVILFDSLDNCIMLIE
ncbi:5114_t:CDS:2 [Entrophospora sp. SA101]|nr:5114_t:CDS:2 [Entrophospora sp. SA101]CAJ0890368.1 12095_t:CDS:2 [Entrophospora sp. SA101]CAJ0925495.1 16784_t:CDS:2 [Entrophospora sp. SA101]